MNFTDWILISWGFGLLGVLAVVYQPAEAFRASGHSQRRWLLIELVGGILFVGPITWLLFSIRVRPDVRRAGGRARVLGRMARALDGRKRIVIRTAPAGGQSSVPTGTSAPAQRTCMHCNGRRQLQCPTCNGRIYDPDEGRCRECSGNSFITCPGCRGTGVMV